MSVPPLQPETRSTHTAPRRRALRAATGIALLLASVSACSGLGRTAAGPVSYGSAHGGEVIAVTVEHSQSVRGCHRLPPNGATLLTNHTLIDMVMYETPDCTGRSTAYVATGLMGTTAPKASPWHSYTYVH
ncbi:hypothetical protein ABT084_00880 [Streptomyces sp. NPDC002138]|uniref:hypothetical protein n=1 Tax=Streptomyces sp. NPDC002138 TaxID=3154410 RepID=UPI00331DDE26